MDRQAMKGKSIYIFKMPGNEKTFVEIPFFFSRKGKRIQIFHSEDGPYISGRIMRKVREECQGKKG